MFEAFLLPTVLGLIGGLSGFFVLIRPATGLLLNLALLVLGMSWIAVLYWYNRPPADDYWRCWGPLAVVGTILCGYAVSSTVMISAFGLYAEIGPEYKPIVAGSAEDKALINQAYLFGVYEASSKLAEILGFGIVVAALFRWFEVSRPDASSGV